MHIHNLTRRQILQRACKLGLGTGLAPLGLMTAMAQSSDSSALAQSNDYKALVVVFLFGGNDSNNVVVPYDNASYNRYAATRGPVALKQAELVPLVNPRNFSTTQSGGVGQFALHPSLKPLQSIWDAGKLALLMNVGPLALPTTKAQFAQADHGRPTNLFAHPDQQQQWMAGGTLPSGLNRSGWGGRLADQFSTPGASTLPVLISTNGNAVFTVGASSRPLSVPFAGNFGLSDRAAYQAARRSAMQSLTGLDGKSELLGTHNDILASALANSAILSPIINNANSSIAGAFAGVDGRLSDELLAVAKMIEMRAQLGLRRQIYFVSVNGFDTHNDQISRQNTLLSEVAGGLGAFYLAMTQLGVSNNVTTVTMSDFARTYKPNSAGGTDHAWGGHQLIMGGAVRGQQYYGTAPTLALGGPDDATGEGRWIPTTSVDQSAATLARWFGVSPAALPTLLPNLANFTAAGWRQDLGFMA